MSGCRSAVAAAQRYREPPTECRLAYDLHAQFGRVCSRKGGNAVCGECIGDIDAPAMGFRRVDAAEVPKERMPSPPDAIGTVSAATVAGNHHGAAHGISEASESSSLGGGVSPSGAAKYEG